MSSLTPYELTLLRQIEELKKAILVQNNTINRLIEALTFNQETTPSN